MKLQTCLENIRRKRPLVHSLTNDVTVTDCANALLAVGAAPIMATGLTEIEEMTAMADAVYLNIGTLTDTVIPSMIRAAEVARSRKKPIVLDPVGAGATSYRTSTARRLLDTGGITLIRGNVSEIRAVAGQPAATRGTDAAADENTESRLEENIQIARDLAAKQGGIVGVSGPTDIVTDGKRTILVRNGHPIMTTVTGTGCVLSALTAAFLGANPNEPLAAIVAAFCLAGRSGEIAASRLQDGEGPMTWRVRFFDSLALLDGQTLQKGARYDLR